MRAPMYLKAHVISSGPIRDRAHHVVVERDWGEKFVIAMCYDYRDAELLVSLLNRRYRATRGRKEDV